MKPEHFSKAVDAKPCVLSRFALLLGPLGVLVAVAVADAAPRQTQTWYVSASAAAGGNGTATAPFNSLAAVQQVYGPGDTIMIEPSPLGVPPLNGGIALLPGQRLIGDGPPVVQFTTSLNPQRTTGGSFIRPVIAAADYQYNQLSFRGCRRTGE
jgi:hypothetical protein